MLRPNRSALVLLQEHQCLEAFNVTGRIREGFMGEHIDFSKALEFGKN